MPKPRRVAALVATGGLLLAAGCGAGAPDTRPAPAPVTTTSTAPASGAPPAETTDPAAGSGGGPDGGAAQLPRCTTGDLEISLGEPEGAAGSVYRALVFTNTGATTCELRGFPGVSYVAGEDGHQVGPAAEMSGERGGQVPIPPGSAAQAQLQLVNVQNFDPAVCEPTAVRGLRVYPPGDTAAQFVPLDGTGCAATPPGPQLSVQTITP